jgi:predicted nuclease of predicted toxin-antitoxin system
VRPLDYPLLADENIHPAVVAALRGRGKDVTTVLDARLIGRPDLEILRRAHQEGRVVLTHDADFASLVIAQAEPFVGIIYLRPGHIAASLVLEVLAAIERAPLSQADVAAPFLLVAERKEGAVRVRLRRAH